MRKDQDQVPKIPKKREGMTHIISIRIVNHQAPNFQGMPERCRQMVFGQPIEKYRKNAINFFPDFRTNSKVFIHPNLKKKKIHNTITT